MGVLDDATTLLLHMASFGQMPGDSKKGRYSLDGAELSKETAIEPDRVNDAVDVLEENGYVSVMRFLGTAPFAFGNVELTARGRVEAERLATSAAVASAVPLGSGSTLTQPISRSPSPVGSPYGFGDEDWEAVMRARDDAAHLIVVLGHQWASPHFTTADLRKHVGDMFLAGLTDLKAKHAPLCAQLDYRPLQGGYGGHLFNEIARDIISADIAVFETSDLNPNVMIEMGVALTWGVRVLPIREAATPKPPSDISGQTWAEYQNSAATWNDADHDDKLVAMVERALRKKGATF